MIEVETCTVHSVRLEQWGHYYIKYTANSVFDDPCFPYQTSVITSICQTGNGLCAVLNLKQLLKTQDSPVRDIFASSRQLTLLDLPNKA